MTKTKAIVSATTALLAVAGWCTVLAAYFWETVIVTVSGTAAALYTLGKTHHHHRNGRR